MKYTDSQNLPCPDLDDPGAVSVYLQCLAEKLEEEFSEKLSGFNSFDNFSAGLWSNSGVVAGDGFSTGITSFTTLDNIFWNDLENPDTISLPTVTSYNLPGQFPGAIYAVGMSVFFTMVGSSAGGAIGTDLWLREFSDASGGDGDLEVFNLDITENTGATSNESLNGEYRIVNNQIPYNKTVFNISLQNAGSGTYSVAAGGAIVWAILLGEGDLVEVM